MKQFRNYNFDFDKNERKILTNFAKQVLKQLGEDNKYFAEERAYNSILEKLKSGETIKLTKVEYFKLSMQLKENIKFLKPKVEKGFFLKRWLYKSVYMQYKNLTEKYFSD